MAHTSRCGSARTDAKKCRCSCGGNAHGGGAFGSINTASGPTATVRTLTRDEVDSRETISKGYPSKGGKDRTVIEEIVDWLAANPTVKDQVDSIAEIVGAQSVKAFNQYGHATSRPRLRVSHLLCGLLANLARAIDEFKQQLEPSPRSSDIAYSRQQERSNT